MRNYIFEIDIDKENTADKFVTIRFESDNPDEDVDLKMDLLKLFHTLIKCMKQHEIPKFVMKSLLESPKFIESIPFSTSTEDYY